MRSWSILSGVAGALLLAGCGEQPNPAAEGADEAPAAEAAQSAEPAEATKVIATREMLEQAYTCRGLMSAAWASVQVLPEGERPEALADLTTQDSSVWNKRIGMLDDSSIPEAEVNEFLAKGTRVLATREALERELPAIAECRKAAAEF